MDSLLQPLLLDTTHIKEALIIVLLNAAQAFDYNTIDFKRRNYHKVKRTRFKTP
jgi:hypothetical protein